MCRYQGLIEAMDAVGLNEAEKNSVVRIVAAVLMLGHIAFEETFGDIAHIFSPPVQAD